MGAITGKEELLEYLKQAINVESAVVSQENVIQEYDETSEERKPQLKLLDAPQEPQISREIQNPNDLINYDVLIGVGILCCAIGAIIILIGIAMAANISENAGDFFWSVVLIVAGVLSLLGAFSISNKAKENYDRAMNAYHVQVEQVEKQNEYRVSQYAIDMETWKKSNDSAHAYFEKPLQETQAVLDKLYSVNVIYPKYRNLPALTCIYEYLVTGRCDELAGPHGAYNLYEDEVRQNMVISQLNTIMENLEQIKANQYLLYEQLTKIRAESAEITHELRMIHGYTAELRDISSLSAYYAGIAASNSTALAYYRGL